MNISRSLWKNKEQPYNAEVRIHLWTLAISTILLACSPDVGPSDSDLPSTDDLNRQQVERYLRTPRPQMIHWGELDNHLSAYELACQDCPLSMGKLVTMTVDGTHDKPVHTSGNCFGGLIGDNRFLTSRHCLPEDLREENQGCENRVRVIFPKLNNQSTVEVGECKKVVALSSSIEGLADSDIQPDWAIIELKEKRPDRVTEVLGAGIPDATDLFAFVSLVNPDTERFAMYKIKCTSRQNTMSLPEYNSDESALVLLDCEQDITKGFSGSLLYQKVEEAWRPAAALSHVYDVQINQEDIIVSKSIVASSIFCMDHDGEAPDSCGFDPTQTTALRDQLVIAAIDEKKEEIKERIQSILGDDNPFEWEDVTVEAVEEGRSTSQMEQKWQQIQSLNQPSIGRPGRVAFFEALAPLAPRCLKPESVPDRANGRNTTARVPVVRMQIVQDNSHRIRIQFQVHPTRVEIYEEPQSPGTYYMGSQQNLPERGEHPRALITAGVNFAATSLAVCE